ncbi:hypothetical protein GCM10022197_05070 [Microlunatus spumicola]|uniref:Uncharacterized protein n=1 Tax=Microlunatus spumicola TaxID=81499 RepID=A0ABP6WKJ9_9ACTN
MTDAGTLGSQLYARLAELVAPPGSLEGTQNLVLVEPCGRDLDLDDFATDPDVAGAEAFAELVNVVPAPGATFVDSSRRLDDVTRMVLLNAATDAATSPAAAILVEQARADLELMARGSVTPGDVYHPARPDPARWWDTAEPWPSVSFTIGGSAPPAAPPPDVVPVQAPPLVWTTCPAVGVLAEPVRVAATGRLSLARLRSKPDLRDALSGHLARATVVPDLARPAPGLSAARLAPLLSARTGLTGRGLGAALRADRVRPVAVRGRPGALVVDDPPADAGLDVGVRRPHYRDLLVAHQLLVDAAPTAPVQPAGGFELSFSYRVVSITRPWWHPELFVQPGWTMPGFAPGAVSTGTPTQNPGLLGAVTTRMLLIRDLTVRGSWSGADASAAEAAQEQFGTLGLGPFSLTGDVGWDHTSLTRPGTQAVAWVAALTPLFPPAV